MTGTEGFIGGISALALTAVYWAYDKIVTHDKQIGILLDHAATNKQSFIDVRMAIADSHDALKDDMGQIQTAINSQADICRQVLMRSTKGH